MQESLTQFIYVRRHDLTLSAERCAAKLARASAASAQLLVPFPNTKGSPPLSYNTLLPPPSAPATCDA